MTIITTSSGAKVRQREGESAEQAVARVSRGDNFGSVVNSTPNYGASGRGEFDGGVGIDGRTAQGAMALGIPTSEHGDYMSDVNYVIPTGKYAGQRASELSSQIPTELRNVDAQARMLENRAKQTSALTSYSFSPETLSGVKSAAENFRLSLDKLNDPYKSPSTRKDELGVILNASSADLAKNFNSVDEFYAGLQNPEIQKNLTPFFNAGGDVTSVVSEINKKGQVQNTQQQLSTPDYLAQLNSDNRMVNDPVAAKRAEQDLFTEGNLAQNRIAQMANIPEELKRYYFGDERTMGALEMQVKKSEETIRQIEDKIRDERTSIRERGRFEISKVRTEMDKAIASTEQNRLTAKNYVSGMLAKLGALKTTGEAPVAIAKLDQKYEEQKGAIQISGQNAIREIEVDMNNRMRAVEQRADDMIMRIREDLSRSANDMTKEIMKAQQTADKDIYSIVNSYANKLRSTTEKYENEIKKSGEKYMKDFTQLVDGRGYSDEFAKQILSGKVKDPKNSQGQYIRVEGMPEDLRDSIVGNIVMNGARLSQLYSAYPQVSRTLLTQIFNRFSSETANPTRINTAVSSDVGSSSVATDVSEIPEFLR
jgi:hypothetical protein